MKHFYNANPAVTVIRPAAKALGTALSSTNKIFMLMLVGFSLLVSGKGYGQATFTAARTGNWSDPGTWNAPGGALPGANDNVLIDRGYVVTLNSNTTINNLTIAFKTGNSTPSLVINGDLTVNNINVNASNNANGSIATITLNGNLIVNQTSTWTANGKYSFICGENSTVTYNGITSILPIQIYNASIDVRSPGQYNNLILGNTGNKTAASNIDVRKNLVVRDAATFSQGSFSHTVSGNLSVQSSGASIVGNSTGASNLTVGGNVTNSGTITLVSRVLTVGGNFTNNSGATFTAGSGTHTVSGNWTSAGTLNAGTSTVILNGASTINGAPKTILSTGAFNNLTVSNGAPELLSDITVNASLVVTGLKLDTKNQKIVLGPAASLAFDENSSQHILGTIETTRSLPANRTSTEIFGNIGFRIPAGTTDLGSVKVRRVTGKVYVSPITNNSSVPRQYYVSSASGLPTEGLVSRVEMNFPGYELGAGAYTIYRITGSNNEIVESLTNDFANDSDFKYRLNNAQKFGMYTLGNTVTPLPVELVSFKAQRHVQGVHLTWMTASEKDNSGFEVQASTDGKKFQKIGFVKSDVGTSSMTQRYSFLDMKAVSGTRYYRLAQIDLDGTTTYFAIRAVALDGTQGEVAAYPNPFEEVVTVRLNGVEARNVSVTLTNAMGKVMLAQQGETAGSTVTVNTSGITAKGVYLLHVVDNGEKHTFKLMKK